MKSRKDYSQFVSVLLDLRALGMHKRQIIADGYLNTSEYKEAAKLIAENALTAENPVMQETSKIEETAPEIVKYELKETKSEKPKPPRISSIAERYLDKPRGKVHRFLVTAAQDDTPVFRPFWENMKVYAKLINAEIIVGGFTYQKGLFTDHNQRTASYDPEVQPFMEYDRVHLSEDLLLVADANILPTTANPLNGWLTVNHGNHVLIPHARIASKVIPRMQGKPAKRAASTGCCTVPSYAPRAAGRKAIFHHTYGFQLVEIDTDGRTFFRHVTGDDYGNFQDLTTQIVDGEIIGNCRIRGLVPGDWHHQQLDARIAAITTGVNIWSNKVTTRNNILDWFQPEYVFFHDTLDFRFRNHHGIADPHERARIAASTSGDVEDEVRMAAAFINACRRPWSTSIMVESNHDAAIAKWLKGDDGRFDGLNAHYWHSLNAEWHRRLRAKDNDFNVVEFAMREVGLADDVYFIKSGHSFMLDDVECGLHGDLGINGSRSAPAQYRRFGVKTNSGHTHSPEIIDGQYVAGVSAKLDQGYNKGPTTWAHAHILQYHNTKRCLLHIEEDGRFMATGDLTFEETEILEDELLAA